MNAVILGAGVVGFQIASSLIDEGRDVVVIEKDPERARHISNHLDCIVINEEGNNVVTLRRAGIEKADLFISVTNSDEVNMIACAIVSSEFNVPVKIARVRNLDYSQAKIFEESFLGIDYIVNSEVETSMAIVNTIHYGAISDVMLFENSSMQIRNFTIDENSLFNNRSLKELRITLDIPFLVAGISRNDTFIIPTGDTRLQTGDNVYILAREEFTPELHSRTKDKEQKLERIVIVGGGKIGRLVAKYLLDSKRKITIIDNDYDHCKLLSEQFPSALVLHSDISDEGIFEEEQLNSYDLIVTTTNNQELNLLTAVYAKSIGLKRSIALVTKSNYLTIASSLEVDSTVSPKMSTVDAILKYIRRGNIRSVHSLFDGKAQVIEFSLDTTSRSINKKIMELRFPEDSLILSVIRNGIDHIPLGQFELKAGDTVIAIAGKNSITKLEDLFTD